MKQWQAVYYAENGNQRREIGIGQGDTPRKAIRKAQKEPGEDGSRVPRGWRVCLELAERLGDGYSVCVVAFGNDADREALRMHNKAARGGGR